MKTSNALLAFIAATLTAGVSGCGPSYQQLAPHDSFGGIQSSAAVDSSGNDADFNCPAKNNVVPDHDWEFDGSGFYTVCASRTSSYEILVHGRTHAANQLCVFPAQYIDETHLYLKPDQFGKPLSICGSVDSMVRMNFEGVNFNAAFIVERQDRDQMQSCLVGGNYFACPHYSYGKFR